VNLSSARILVVDDIPDNRDVLVRRLQRLQLTNVEQAADGLEALRLLRAGPFDLVLLDVMMPNMNGIEVLETMRAEGLLESTPVLMISAASEIDTVVRCIGLGAEDYLPKPFNAALLAARVKAVLEKKFLRAENKRQFERFERELAEARQHQLSMLPVEFPVDSDVIDIHAMSDPALEVGGDLYDVFEVRPGVLCIAIGDVAGKGAAAGLFMARTRSLLRAGTLQFQAIAGRVPRPSEIATLLNEELCKNNPQSTFVTLFLGFLDIASGELYFCNAGHIPPLVAAGAQVRAIVNEAEPALGILDVLVFSDHVMTLGLGETLLLTSDGLSDMLNPASEHYGDARIEAEIAGMPDATAAELVNHLVAAVHAFADGAPQFDDITLVALRRLG
jgi:serine phosphatase RsbU (regulator of sigma subunit)